MAAKDKYHDVVRTALEKDGWTITHDPLRLRAHGRNVKIDLGAEKLIGAEKEGEKIAVEIKSFAGFSVLTEFYAAVGQCIYYQAALDEEDPERTLFLAVPKEIYENFFSEELSTTTIERSQLHIVVYNIISETLEGWNL